MRRMRRSLWAGFIVLFKVCFAERRGVRVSELVVYSVLFYVIIVYTSGQPLCE